MGMRGLEPNNNHQTFSVLTTYKLSSNYGKAMRPLIDTNKRKQVKDEMDQSVLEKKFASYAQLNRFLMAFIEKVGLFVNFMPVNRESDRNKIRDTHQRFVIAITNA